MGKVHRHAEGGGSFEAERVDMPEIVVLSSWQERFSDSLAGANILEEDDK